MCTANPAFDCDDLARTDLSNDGSRLKPVRLRHRLMTKVVADTESKLLVRNRLGIGLGVSFGWDDGKPSLLPTFNQVLGNQLEKMLILDDGFRYK